MKDYRLTIFYNDTGICDLAAKSFNGQHGSNIKTVALDTDFNIDDIIKDFDYNIYVVELVEEHKPIIKDLLEVLEGFDNVITLIIEPQGQSIYQFSRNPLFHKNILQAPFNTREFSLITDLSIVRHEKKILKRKSHLFNEAVNQSANSIVITNPNGGIEFVNRNFEEVTGYAFREVIGKNPRVFGSGIHPPEFFDKMWKIISMGVKWEGEICNKKKNGDLFWEEITITPIMDENGTIIQYLAIKHDVSERKKADEEVRNSKLLLREIIDRTPQFIFVRDAESRYHLVNKAYADYRGKSPKEIKGRTELEIATDTSSIEKILQEDRQVLEKGIEIRGEEKVFDISQNRYRYFQYVKVPFTLPKTGELSVLSVWTCVTDQKQIEQQVRSTQEKLLDAQKLANFGNWSVDFDSGSASWSEQVYLQYGLDPEKPAPFGKDFYKHIHNDDWDAVRKAIDKAASDGFAKYECRAIKPDGTIAYIEATVKPVLKKDQVAGFFGTSLDITTRKNYEEEIIAARKEAIAASKTKSDFLSVMSHEIRTPLNAIIVMSDVLINEVDDPEHKDNLEILNFSARDLLSIVNDILDYSKIEAGKLELESISINSKDYFGKILKTNYLRAQEKDIKLELIYDDNLPTQLMGDPLRLGQILKNLISNAVKFTERGGVQLIVKQVNRDDDNCRVFFGVKDTGIGIHPGKIDSLFEVFTQASSETSRKFGGTGLGLAIVKNLLFIHNSRILVESEPDKGSLFSFEIDFPYKDTPVNGTKTPSGTTAGMSLKDYSIMLVEDNAMNIMVAKKIFDKWDCKLQIAEDGYIGLQKATRIDFDLILMDLQMPGIDGFETTRKLRKLSEHYSQIPIIALSAAAPAEVAQQVKEAGMDEMVAKPFNPKKLFEVLKSHLPDIPPTQSKTDAPAIDLPSPEEEELNIEILVKLSTVLKKQASTEAIKYLEDVARQKTGISGSNGLMEVVETINSILRINKSYINNKNVLIKEMMNDLKKSLEELKIKYQKNGYLKA